MAGKIKADWNEENVKFLKQNASKGIVFLSDHFGLSNRAIKAKLTKLSIPLFEIKTEKEKEKKPIKLDMNDGFDLKKHKIKNNATEGLVKLWIPSDRMFVYHKPGKDQQAIINKYANRDKSIG